MLAEGKLNSVFSLFIIFTYFKCIQRIINTDVHLQEDTMKKLNFVPYNPYKN